MVASKMFFIFMVEYIDFSLNDFLLPKQFGKDCQKCGAKCAQYVVFTILKY